MSTWTSHHTWEFFKDFNLLEDECHSLDKQVTTTASSSWDTSFEQYMTAKLALRDLENEKLSLTNQVNIAHQYHVLQLLTTQNPQQNPVVISTSKHIHDSTNRIAIIVCEV